MHLMEALGGLNHGAVVVCHLHVSDLLVTELATFLLHFILHLLVVGLSSFSLLGVHEEIHLIYIVLLFISLTFRVGRGIDLHVIAIGRTFLLFVHASVVLDKTTCAHWLNGSTSWSCLRHKHIKQCSHAIDFCLFFLIKLLIWWWIKSREA